MPKISVIMPSYNKEHYIGEAIESIINQTFYDWELIIIDDNSSDHSIDVIESFHDERIRFYKNKQNLGIAGNRNKGIDMAKGQYIALLDADDISVQDRLEKEAIYLDNYQDIDVVFGSFLEIDENGLIKETYFSPLKNPKYIRASLMFMDVIPNGSCMYRKEFIDRYDIRYRDGYLGMDDYLFWVECSLHGNITGLTDVLLYWRNTSSNGTNVYKYSSEHREMREKRYSDILKFALKMNGFKLSESEQNFYCKILSEYKYQIVNKEEIITFYQLIKKICIQSEKTNFSWEIKKAFKKQFGVCLENSYIWE